MYLVTVFEGQTLIDIIGCVDLISCVESCHIYQCIDECAMYVSGILCDIILLIYAMKIVEHV